MKVKDIQTVSCGIWNVNVEFSGLYHHTMFEINRSVNVGIYANVKVVFDESAEKYEVH